LKILIVKPSSLGDVIQALPVLRLLKLHYPASEIYWWLAAELAPLLEGDPDLAGVIPFDRRAGGSLLRWVKFFGSIRRLRAERFDLVIDLQGLARSAVVAWLANADLSIGLDNAREGGREGARGFYDLLAPRSLLGAHAVDRYLSALAALGLPSGGRFEWLPVRPAAAAEVAARWGPIEGQWVILLPGARWDNKRWPPEYFSELVRLLLQEEPALNFAIMGGPADRALGASIAATAPGRCLNLTGRTSLPEMIEWIRLAGLLITNDTGPMHVGAALGKPVVALFGPSDPANTAPFGQMSNVLQNRALPCVPCRKSHCAYVEPLACLRSLEPAVVCAAARRLLRRAAEPERLTFSNGADRLPARAGG